MGVKSTRRSRHAEMNEREPVSSSQATEFHFREKVSRKDDRVWDNRSPAPTRRCVSLEARRAMPETGF